MLHRRPNRPYRNLLLSALVGLPAGIFAYAVYLALFESSSPTRSLVLLADTLPIAMLVLPVMALALLVYGFPLLWLALKLRAASPPLALAGAVFPGGLIWVTEGMAGQLGWISLLISIATGVAYVRLAYRAAPPNNSFKPTSLRDAA